MADELDRPDRSGELIGGKWRLSRLLGTGGMAQVYAAVDPEGRAAALKLLHPEYARRADIKARFDAELRVAGNIDHPGVVQFLEQGTSEQDTYLVMELLDGESLATRTQRLGPPSVGEACAWMLQVLDTLAVAHQRGVIHRDLKPDNLFLTGDGQVRVLDFGVARVRDDSISRARTQMGVALGTLAYMAPEQALGRQGSIDGRADLFSLAATIYRLISGRRVHEADSEAELMVAVTSRPVEPLHTVAPALPESFCAIIDHALAFEASARYPDALTMRDDVAALLAGRPPRHVLAFRQLTAQETLRPTAAHRDQPTVIGGGVDAVSLTIPEPPKSARLDELPSRTLPSPVAARVGSQTLPMPVVTEQPAPRHKTLPLEVAVPLGDVVLLEADAAAPAPCPAPPSTAESLAFPLVTPPPAPEAAARASEERAPAPGTARAVTPHATRAGSSSVGRLVAVALVGLGTLAALAAVAAYHLYGGGLGDTRATGAGSSAPASPAPAPSPSAVAPSSPLEGPGASPAASWPDARASSVPSSSARTAAPPTASPRLPAAPAPPSAGARGR